MKWFWFGVIAGWSVCFDASGYGFYAGNDSLLTELVKAIESRDTYVKVREQRIAKLRDRVRNSELTPAQQFLLYNNLFLENRKFIYDSAFVYASRLISTAHQLGDPSKIGFARAQLGYILVSSGFFKEAFDTLRRVDAALLPDTVRPQYYSLMARAYYDLGDFDNDRHFKNIYFNLGNLYTDSARALCVPDSYYDLYLSRTKEIRALNYPATIRHAQRIRTLFTLPYEEEATNFYDLSHSTRMIGERDLARDYLMRSALVDLKSVTKETAAMHALARLFFEDGDIEHADIFIHQARDDANFYGARQRQVEISAIMPLIAAAKLNSVDAQRKRLLTFSIALGILVLIVIAFLYIILTQLKKIKNADLTIKKANENLQLSNDELREANRIKEEYIGYYFNINAEYLNKIEAFKKALDQKIMAKKWDELRFVADNINLKREREELSYSFDKVFLNLFPEFIQRFNALFNPEDQINLKDGQLMNTELRIFALIRMGINDTERIAKILGYSVNTIYAYKTRVKSKSIIPNEKFEEYIMEIKTA